MFRTCDAARDLATHLDLCLPTYLQELHELCALDSNALHRSDVDEMSNWVYHWAKLHHWEVYKWPDLENGKNIVVTVRGGTTNGPRILLTTHLDTLHPTTTHSQQKLQHDGDRLICPGIADNKSGLLSGLYATAALESLGLLEPFGDITLFCGSDGEDEGHGMPSSAALLRELAPNYDISLVLEAGYGNGDIIGTRKGCGHLALEVRGQIVQTDELWLTDENAIVTLAKHIIALQQLNTRTGITLNAGIVRGVTPPLGEANVAYAEIAAWVASSKEKEIVNAAMKQLASMPSIASTTTRFESDWRFAPIEETPENVALAGLARECAHELNFDVVAVQRDGLSYANLLAGLGLPVLDGLGPTGDLLHTEDEYINVSSIMPRTALLALLMFRKAEQWQ